MTAAAFLFAFIVIYFKKIFHKKGAFIMADEEKKDKKPKKTPEEKLKEAKDALAKTEEAIKKANDKLKELKLKKLDLIEKIESLKK